MRRGTGSAKPGFRRGGAVFIQPVKLTVEQRDELLAMLPAKWRSAATSDDAGRTDSQRFLEGIESALAYYDATPTVAIAGGPVSDDLETILRAAKDLMEKIRNADPLARTALDCEAVAMAFSGSDAHHLSSLGRTIIQHSMPLGQVDGGDGRSLLSSLWDLANDTANAAAAAKNEIQLDRNARPERMNASRLAWEIVLNVSHSLGRMAPRTQEFFEAAKYVGSLRNLTVGRAIVTDQLKNYAARFAPEP